MNKTAIVILSDPDNGGDEALGRVFNALVAAYDIKQSGGSVSITFQGAGSRWVGHITKADHAVHGLYQALKSEIAGVSSGCADVFGAAERAREQGFSLITECPVPGTSGLPSFAKLLKSGATILTF